MIALPREQQAFDRDPSHERDAIEVRSADQEIGLAAPTPNLRAILGVAVAYVDRGMGLAEPRGGFRQRR